MNISYLAFINTSTIFSVSKDYHINMGVLSLSECLFCESHPLRMEP